MSGSGINLRNISENLDSSLAKDQAKNYRIFRSKNERVPTEQDRTAVSSYSRIINTVGQAFSGWFGGQSSATATTSLRTLKTNSHSRNRPQHSSQPLRPSSKFSNIKTATNENPPLSRCDKCSCAVYESSGCKYCKNPEDEIEMLDSDCEEFPSIEHCIQKTSPPPQLPPRLSSIQYQNTFSAGITARTIPTDSFYFKENSSLKKSPNNQSNRSDIMTCENDEVIRYEIDYLYIGTIRFISRARISITGEEFRLSINGKKKLASVNIDYKLVRKAHICEASVDSSRHTYMMFDLCAEAVDVINLYLKDIDRESGVYKVESINGHERYFIMKLKYLEPDEALKLRQRLKMHLPKRLAEDSYPFKLFTQQREYERQRSHKKIRTTDCRTRNQEKLKNQETSTSDSIISNQQDYSRRPSLRRLAASGSRNLVEEHIHVDDPEISEIAKSKTNLPIKNIKCSRILYTNDCGESMTLRRSDLVCLNEGNFLNDEIIEFYLMFIKSKVIPSHIASKTYIFSSFFFTKLLSLSKGSQSEEAFMEKLYGLVKNWTKNIDIFDYDYLIVPIFRNYHWSLAIVVHPGKMLKDDFEIILDCEDREKPAIIFMDSMGRNRMCNKTIQFGNDQMPMIEPQVPRQQNGYDCGIFVLHYVELFLKDADNVIEKIRANKASLSNWFRPDELRRNRAEIFGVLLNIHEDNLKNDLGFESEEELTAKSDEEICILTDDDKNKDLLSDDDDSMQ